MTTATRPKTVYRCDRCQRMLKPGRWIAGRDTRLTDGKRRPRYCWVGEGCQRGGKA